MFSLSNTFLVRYAKESKEELKKVTWPSRKILIQHTILVLGICAIAALFIGGLDYLLNIGFQNLLSR